MFDKKNVEDIRLLNNEQNSILISGLKNNESKAYIHHLCFELTGNVDINLFKKAYNCLINKYSVLRSVILYQNVQKPVQVIMKKREETCTCIEVEEEDLEVVSENFINEETKKLGKLEGIFLFDMSICKGRESVVQMIISFHHIILDGWSLGLIVSDFFYMYNSLKEGKTEFEKEQFYIKDYINWKKKSEIEDVSVKVQEMIQNCVEPTSLEVQWDVSDDYKEGNISFILDEKLYKDIDEYCRRNEITSNAFFLGAWATLLAKYNQTQDVSFGTVLSGRNGKVPAIEEAVGLFIQTVPIILQVKWDESMIEVMKKINELFIIYMQEPQSINYCQEKGTTTYNHVVAFENYPIADLLVSQNGKFGVEISNVKYLGYTNFDFGIALTPIENRTIELVIKYNVYCYTKNYMTDLIKAYENIIKSALYENIRVGDIPLLDKEEEEKAYLNNIDWNIKGSLIEKFEDVLKKSNLDRAVSDESRVLTYEELENESNKIAHALHNQNIKSGDIIAIWGERSVEIIIAMLGILKVGAAYLAINANFSEGRMKQYLEEAKVKAILAQDKVCVGGVPEGYNILSINELLSDEKANSDKLDIEISEDALAYVIYTSGSTGKPKGIGITHKNIINLVNGLIDKVYSHYDEKLKVGVITSFMFDASVKQIYGALLNGHELCIASEEERSSGRNILDFYKRALVDISDGTPTHIRLLLQDIVDEECIKVKEFLIGGEQLTKELSDSLFSKAKAEEKIIISNVYGPSECCVDTTIFRFSDTKNLIEDVIPIGKSLKNYQTIIVDHKGKVLPKGVKGELLIGGPSVSRGYINSMEETEKHFILNPYNMEHHLYRTGDLVKQLPDGNIRFIGRIDNQVKLNGYRMELDEIEECALASGKIQNVAVIIRENEEHSNYLCLFFVEKMACEEKELREYLKKRLPEYMIPSIIMKFEELPINSNGKIDRKALKNMELNIEVKEDNYEAAENETQLKLCSIFQRILKVDRVSINSNFYELGGTSLNAISLVSEIYKKFNTYLSPGIIFKYPVIKELAEQISIVRNKAYHVIEKRENEFYGKATSEQERLYALTYEDEGESYHIQQGYEFEQYIETEKLKECIRILLERHESLRTCFFTENGEIKQKVLPVKDLNCNVTEGENIDNNWVQLEFKKLRKPYNLEDGYLYRFSIYQSRKNTLILFDAHHIIIDGQSVGILFDEFFALLQGKELLNTPYHMIDYANWQRKFCKSEEYRMKESYFKERLNGCCNCSIIPDKVLHKQQNYTEVVVKNIDSVDSDRIIKFANKHSVTLNMLMSATFSVLLSKYTYSSDILYGTVTANRKNPNFSKSVGMFVNTLIMRTFPEKEKSFDMFLGEVKEQMIALVENEEYLYSDLIRLEEVSTNPINILFVMEKDFLKTSELDLYGVKPLKVDYADAKFDLAFYCAESEEGLQIRVEYNTSLYYKKTVQVIIESYIYLLKGILENDKRKIKEFEIADEKQKALILDTFNDTVSEYAFNDSIIELFKKEVHKRPWQTALIWMGKNITYKELNDVTDCIAWNLIEQGVEVGEVIAFYLDDKVNQIMAIISILKAGAIYMPIDTAYPIKRIRHMLQDSGAKFILTEKAYKNNSEISGYKYVCIEDLKEYKKDGSSLKDPEIDGDSPAYLMYTSGTTGKAKGVIVKHKNVIRLVNNTEFMKFKEGEKFLQTSSVVFDASTLEIWGSLLNGMSLCLTTKEVVLDAIKVKEYIVQENIYALWLSAPLFNQLSQGNEDMFQGVTWLLVGGDILPAEQINKVRKMNPKLHIINGYGPTENTTFSTTFDINEDFEDIPIGYPITNSRVYIMDEGKNLLPVGAVGEICVGGEGVAVGYLNDEELTNSKFIEDPFVNGEKIYCTGDIGKWNELGYIEFLGRRDNQIKIRGFRVETKEIEQIVNRHENIQQSLVDVREKDGLKYLVLFYVGTISRKELKEYLKGELPEYMRPTYVVELDKVPLNDNGKVDYSQIRMIKEKEILSDEYIEPRNEVEKNICNIWQSVLGIDRIGITDNYYELGGDSLRAIKIISRINGSENSNLTFKDILLNPTVKLLTQRLEEVNYKKNIKDDAAKIETNTGALSVQQQRICNATLMDKNSNAYNIICKYVVNGSLDDNKFKDVVSYIGKVYPILNTVYSVEGTTWKQEVRDMKIPVQFEYITEDELEKYEKSFNKPIQIDNGDALCSFCVIRTDKEKTILLIKIHHSISDGISTEILVNKLIEGYLTGSIVNSGAHYRSYIEYQNQLRTEEFKKQKAKFWRELYKEKCEYITLPTDYLRPQALSYEGSGITQEIPSKLREHIIDFAKNHNVTNYVLLLVAYQVLLYRYSEQTSIPIGIFHSGRMIQQFEETIGMFVNTIPLKFKIEESIEKMLIKTRDLFLSAVENSDYYYEDILKDVQYDYCSNRNPLFDVTFSYFGTNKIVTQKSNNIELEQVPIKSTTSKFDLSFDVRDDGEKMYLSVSYKTVLYKESTIRTMIDGFINILKSMCEENVLYLSELSLCSKIDKQRIKEYYSKNQIDYGNKTFIDMLYQWENSKDKIAFKDSVGEISYAQLIIEAEKMAFVLYSKGVRSNDVVIVIADASIKMYITYVAILMIGAAFLPVDTRYPVKRINYIINDIGAEFVIVGEKKYDEIIEVRECISLDELFNLEETKRISVRNVKPESLAYVIYTSGSTGNPKGVIIEQKALINLCNWHNRQYEVSENTVTMKYAGIGFDASIWEVFPYLCAGATICIPPEEIKLDMEALDQYIARNGVTIAFLPTQICEEYIHLEEPHLKVILTGGDKLKKFKKGNYILYNNYGPTENCVVSTSFRVEKQYNNIPIGKPVDNCRIYILNKDMQIQPQGVPGEIYIAGASLARGYVGMDKLTQESFLPDILFEEERMYRTGDWGKYMEDGNILFLGRQDSQVKIRGNRIELAEIQSTIMKYEKVEDVLLRVDIDNENNQYLIAYIIPREGYNKMELYGLLKQNIPYYMIPNYLIEVEIFPLNENGKVDYSMMPKPNEKIEIIVEKKELSDLESIILNIWDGVLHVGTIGLEDDFFQLGGDSIKAMRILHEIQNIVNKKLSISDIFNYPTVDMLARRCEQLKAEQDYGFQQFLIEEEFEEISQQEKSMIVMASYTQNSIAYNEPMIYKLNESVNINKLIEVIKTLICRHVMLHSIYEIKGNNIVRRKIDVKEIQVNHINNICKDSLDKTLNELIEPFEVFGSILHRVYVIEIVESKEKYLLWDCFHGIADGLSRAILQQELIDLYNDKKLTEVLYDYNTYAKWQKSLRQSEWYKNIGEYWNDVLVAPLPNKLWEYKAKDTRLLNGKSLVFNLDDELVIGLKNLAYKRKTTLYVILLSIYYLVLVKETKKKDIIIGCADVNREQSELENMIGMFVNMLPIRIKCIGEQTYGEFLERLISIYIKIQQNKEYLFYDMVANLEKETQKDYNEIIETIFQLQDFDFDFDGNTVMSDYSIPYIVAKYKLAIFILHESGKLRLSINFNENIFTIEKIEQIFLEYCEIAQKVIKSEEEIIFDITGIDKQENSFDFLF